MRFVPTGRCLPSRAPWLVALAVALAAPTPARAQMYTWNLPTSGGDWMTGSNWLPSGPPNATSTVAVFGNVLTGSNTVTVSAGATIGELRFTDVNTRSTTTAYTIGSSGQTLTFNNGTAANLIDVVGITSTNQTVAANVSVASAQPLTITADGAPGLTTLTLSGSL